MLAILCRPRGRDRAGSPARLPVRADGVLSPGVGAAGLVGLGGAELAGSDVAGQAAPGSDVAGQAAPWRPGDIGQHRMGARAVDEHHPSVRRARRDHERAGARRSARWCSSIAPTTSIITTGTPRSGCPASPPNWSRSPARCSVWWSATTCWCSTCSGSSPRCCRSCWSATTPSAPPAAGPRLRRCWSRRSAGWRCWSASSCSATCPAPTCCPN